MLGSVLDLIDADLTLPTFEQSLSGRVGYLPQLLSMPTLYYLPGSAAMAPHAALEEAGVSYKLALVERDDGRARPNYLAVNPLGRVPAYVDGNLVLWESAAIVLHLAEAHPDAGLLPAPASAERAVAVRWLVYLTNTVQAAFMDFGYPHRLVGDDSPAVDAVREGARARLDQAFDHIDASLGRGPYLLGPTFSAADLYLYMVTRWCRRLPRQAWTLPYVGPHYALLSERPSVKRMLERQGIVAYPDDT
jgi:glutathione S-transferase